MALTGVLGDGLPFSTGGKSVKDVAGYALKDLLVGSEGTLGIITEATFKLIPPPQTKRTLLAYFKDTRTAGEAVSSIIAAKIIPSTLEIMDNATIKCVEGYAKIGLPLEMAALLLMRPTASKRFYRESELLKFKKQLTLSMPGNLLQLAVLRFRLWREFHRRHCWRMQQYPAVAWLKLLTKSNALAKSTGSRLAPLVTPVTAICIRLCSVTSATGRKWSEPTPSTMTSTKRFWPGVAPFLGNMVSGWLRRTTWSVRLVPAA
jgi:hypothetical protein